MELDPNKVNNLYDRSDPKYRHLIGKRVRMRYKGKTWKGVVEFIGVNDLHGQFQVTLDRTPYWPVDPSSIVEIPHIVDKKWD